ncbi:MAG TPA: ATP-binding cassette domain-containing protein [Methylophilaceae bacterium]|nr:ATP-binding cassette domain-containing protein [Methylophilaceae bacterium]
MSLLEVQGLRKAFGERLLFDIPQLSLERGKSYVVTGSNGVGKTTLLRILAGLEPADMSNYVFDGRRIGLPEIVTLAPAIIYMHQHPYLFHSSVAANIAYGLKGRGLSKAEITRRVKAEVAWAGLEAVAKVPPSRLSGGEKQRVALARARVLKPRLLLLDEPTANLDLSARGQVVELIARMGDEDSCVLVATHDRELIDQSWSARYALANAQLQPL